MQFYGEGKIDKIWQMQRAAKAASGLLKNNKKGYSEPVSAFQMDWFCVEFVDNSLWNVW